MSQSPQFTVVICSHNGAALIHKPLAGLARQRLPPGTSCEVLVIDNASTDGTRSAASTAWHSRPDMELRIVSEPVPGLAKARVRGLTEARGPVIGFLDDDNVPAEDWVAVALKLFASNARIGAAGGLNEPVFMSPPPAWFSSLQAAYAVGPQADESGDVTDTRRDLFGAGLIVRRSAWHQLSTRGFDFTLSGRTPEGLSSGEDSELCRAMRLAGWRLWYEPELRLQHHLAQDRLTSEMVIALHSAFGRSSTVVAAYDAAGHPGIKGILARRWWPQYIKAWLPRRPRPDSRDAVVRAALAAQRSARRSAMLRERREFRKLALSLHRAGWATQADTDHG